jgi:hypothetical protein
MGFDDLFGMEEANSPALVFGCFEWPEEKLVNKPFRDSATGVSYGKGGEGFRI